MNKIFLHIGAREGSKGIKNKNIRKFLGKPLIYWTLKHAKKVNNFEAIVVNSDSKLILNLAKKMKIDLIIERPKTLSSSKASKLTAWKYALNFLKNRKLISKDDIFVDFDCTCPLRDIKDTNKMIKKFILYKKVKKSFDGIFTIIQAKKNPYFNLVEKNKFGYLKISKNLKKTIVRRQDAPNVYEHVANTYVLKPNFISKTKSFMKGNLFGHVVKDKFSWDIDSDFDFKVAEYLLKDNR
tara:strand:- start:2073 stop:2789 length:717 start_codon:yes stop_codon:yes gene_type:complete